MLTPYLPYPPLSGGQIRSYNLIRQLYRKHQISLFSYIRDDEEKKFIPNLKKYCQKVVVIKRRRAWSPFNILLAVITPYPFLVSVYLSSALKKAIYSELTSQHYDLIHSETFYVMPNIPTTCVPVLLVEQTIEYLVYQRFVEMLPWYLFFLKPLLLLDVAKIRWWEKFFWRKADGLAAMSYEDKHFIQSLDPNLKVYVAPNGVDIDFFKKTKKIKKNKPIVLFVGQFKWLPNQDAAKFLVSKIWPKIKKLHPNAQLLIVGRSPTQSIYRLQKTSDVFVIGDMDDIRDAYKKADVLLAPIRNGRGTKYKILEAMVTKTPIVGTPLSVEGIGIKHQVHALVGRTEEELADFTCQILNNPNLGKKLAKNAYDLVEKRYNWRTVAEELNRIYKEVVNESKKT
jgi:glycosyltransferase involved in cell wall biosynthesis